MALGSTIAGVTRLVLSRGVKQLTIGLMLGLLLAFAATGLMERTGLLFRISARDPWVFSGVPVLLIAVGLSACWLPARRAAKIDPVQALRSE